MADQESNGAAREVQPAAELLPVVYEELRRLAAALAGRLPPGHSLQPTALVHEAYLRLVGEQDPGWHGRRHFFGADTDRSSNASLTGSEHRAGIVDPTRASLWPLGGRDPLDPISARDGHAPQAAQGRTPAARHANKKHS